MMAKAKSDPRTIPVVSCCHAGENSPVMSPLDRLDPVGGLLNAAAMEVLAVV